ncbi:TRAP-type mannitol/chloroaromatic compound transport system, small permease component [Lentibacillus persicus]|uniref:TRAP-type mannitol/chloroaromatic compound transport system, small permease component n=1 Tax=Lentibacillus persicus TaxID=640948 RepID=A0A1I1W4N5_9BACI|nr:TRAP transporter small permease subunit [Lentibacillus persicus]SFD90125.1 TRAP-type mannitol/chloroaromatic compound transport system, small permease component [Lentibacillus persicus]
MKVWGNVERTIDSISEWLGRIGWLIILYALFFGVFDVIMRYFFNEPSLWISTTIQYGMVLLACVSGAYSLNTDSFVKVDLFYEKFSTRKKAICDIITFAFAFLYLYVLITKGIETASASFATRETTPTAVPIPLYHLKAAIPIGAFCVLLVVIKKFVRDIQTVIGDRGT